MSHNVQYLPEAVKDLSRLDNSNRILVRKAIKKVAQNPAPVSEGGYGHPLSNLSGTKLAGFLKIKLRSAGIRIVYKYVKQGNDMLVIVIGARADNEVYEVAEKRAEYLQKLERIMNQPNAGETVNMTSKQFGNKEKHK